MWLEVAVDLLHGGLACVCDFLDLPFFTRLLSVFSGCSRTRCQNLGVSDYFNVTIHYSLFVYEVVFSI